MQFTSAQNSCPAKNVDGLTLTFQRGVDFAMGALERPEAKVFIHCAAGVHRAPMMALAVLGSMGWNVEDAVQMIEARRPVADFADVYVESVERFLNHG
jgi:protein-tyrosine phosphatase